MLCTKVVEGGRSLPWHSSRAVGGEGAHSRRPRPVRVLGMGGPRTTLSVFLIFVSGYLHGVLSQEAGPAAQRKPFFERLRRLEEQVRVPSYAGQLMVSQKQSWKLLALWGPKRGVLGSSVQPMLLSPVVGKQHRRLLRLCYEDKPSDHGTGWASGWEGARGALGSAAGGAQGHGGAGP